MLTCSQRCIVLYVPCCIPVQPLPSVIASSLCFRIFRMAKIKAQEKAVKVRAKSKTSKSLQMPINFIIVTASLIVAVWFGYKGYLETRVNTPYDATKACNTCY